jgi:uncharacterized membrane protein (DUF2068 family)
LKHFSSVSVQALVAIPIARLNFHHAKRLGALLVKAFGGIKRLECKGLFILSNWGAFFTEMLLHSPINDSQEV